jgi:hypothetical protein
MNDRRAFALTVPLRTDPVAPHRLVSGRLEVAGGSESDLAVVGTALFFEIEEAAPLARVTFEGLTRFAPAEASTPRTTSARTFRVGSMSSKTRNGLSNAMTTSGRTTRRRCSIHISISSSSFMMISSRRLPPGSGWMYRRTTPFKWVVSILSPGFQRRLPRRKGQPPGFLGSLCVLNGPRLICSTMRGFVRSHSSRSTSSSTAGARAMPLRGCGSATGSQPRGSPARGWVRWHRPAALRSQRTSSRIGSFTAMRSRTGDERWEIADIDRAHVAHLEPQPRSTQMFSRFGVESNSASTCRGGVARSAVVDS